MINMDMNYDPSPSHVFVGKYKFMHCQVPNIILYFFKEFCMFLQLFVWPICKWVSDVLKIIL